MVHILFAFPVFGFIMLYLAAGYGTYRFMLLHILFDLEDFSDYLFLALVYLVPWMMFPIMALCEWEETKRMFKNKFPNFKLPKFRNPIHFE